MAEKDTGEPDEASLELPSLFGRKKKGKRDQQAAAPPESTEVSAPRESGTPAEETAVIEPVPQPVAPPPTPQATPPTPQATPPATERVPQPATRSAEPVTVPDEPTQQLPPHQDVHPEPAAATPVAEPTRGGGRRVKRTEKTPRATRELPPVRASLAALLVGAIVGLLGAGLTFGALRTCDAITGTDSCGGPGLLIVLVVVVVMVMAGTALLRAFGVSEPGGLSFLGVAIFVAICLVFLVEQLLEPWMLVVGPLLCALGYGTAHWVVNRFNTELLAEEGPETHDVR